jgi:hypothetical protein
LEIFFLLAHVGVGRHGREEKVVKHGEIIIDIV